MQGPIYGKSYQTILAAGSVMEIWPMGNYGRYMPDPVLANSVGSYWRNVHSYLHEAVMQYERGQKTSQGKGLYDE